MYRWRRNYSSQPIPRANIMYPSSNVHHTKRRAKRTKYGNSTNNPLVTNKGDMIVKRPKASSTRDIGRRATFTSNVRQPGTLQSFNIGEDIIAGGSVGNRQGDSIQLLGFNFRMHVYNSNATEVSHGKVRIIVAYDKQPNISTVTGLFMSEGVSNTPIDFNPGAVGPDSFRLLKPINTMRYNVLYDKTVDAPITLNPVIPQLFLNEYIPLNVNQKFSTVSGTAGVTPTIRLFYFIESENNLAFSTGVLFKNLYITKFAR
mgnify:CR=1 FL=1